MISWLVQRAKNNLGLSLLILILSLITLTSIKPEFYLVGWDNYSSYFNLKTNIFRTFFATWREYRGLGVPSDSESTDLFRQIFYLILKPFVPETLLDQLYILTALNLGTLSMYFLAKKIFSSIHEHLNEKTIDILSFVSAFFYLFNLNTLSTFYFPMIMYINRYWSLPLLILIFYSLLHTFKISRRILVLIILAFLFVSGSYVTATVLITTLMAIFLFSIFHANFKKAIVLLLFYISLNLFWLLPFANYTFQKSALIRLAPTFIDANEIQLNKPKSFYDLRYQLILYPNFFESKYKDISLEKDVYFHSLAGREKNPVYYSLFFIFPLLYLLGAVLILYKWKKMRPLLWAPCVIFIFLFLVLKEFSPLGFVYSFLDRLTPYFGVLFRFGDTKFHPYIAFAGSITASYAVLSMLRLLSRKIVLIIISLIVLSYLFVYQDYLRGKLIGHYMYNKIPAVYFEITKRINSDKDDTRVLHLPYDRQAYWKMYSWGMVGSSFLHFMLDKPLIEKTFEPASMENAYLNKKLDELIYNSQSPETVQQKRNRAQLLYTLLKKTGVKYIIYDGSVQGRIYPRGITLWGDFNVADSKAAVSALVDYGFADILGDYKINLNDYKDVYKKWKERGEEEKKLISENSIVSIKLIALKDYTPKISFLAEAVSLDPDLDNELETDLSTSHEIYIRDRQTSSFTLFPFKRNNANLALKNNTLELSFPRQFQTSNVHIKIPKNINLAEKDIANLISVYAKRTGKDIVFSLYLEKTPVLSGRQNRIFLKEIKFAHDDTKLAGRTQLVVDSLGFMSDWSSINSVSYGNLRLRVGEVTIPVPLSIEEAEQFIGSVLVRGGDIPIEVLAFAGGKSIDPKTLVPTENPNCFEDALEDFQFTIDNTSDFKFTGQNGSACFYRDLSDFLEDRADYGELALEMSGETSDLDDFYLHGRSQNSKPALRNAITSSPKLNLLRVCIKEYNIEDCYNRHYFVELKNRVQNLTFPTDKTISDTKNLLVFFSLKNNLYQRQQVSIKSMTLNLFDSIQTDTVSFDPNSSLDSQVDLGEDKTLTISFTKPVSAYTYYFQSGLDGLYISNNPCPADKLYRTLRRVGGRYVSFVEDCYNEIFQTIPFSSNNFYLWAVSYNLLSGKFPTFILDDGFYSYKNEFFSLNQGYPDIEGFKIFQDPEPLFSRPTSNEVVNIIQNAKPRLAYTYQYPQAEIGDRRPKDFTIHEDSENEGVMTFDSYDIVELPSQWADLSIQTSNISESYDLPIQFNYKQILPSLWKIQIPDGSSGSYLLLFNEAFDRQWVGYSSLWGVIFNLGRSYGSLPCNSFANCFQVVKESRDKVQTIYLLYTPERLNFLGWILTFLGIALFAKILLKKDLVSS